MNRIIRRRELCQLIGLSYSSIYRQVRNGTFPQPIALGTQAIGWYADEIEAWLDSRQRAVEVGVRNSLNESAATVPQK